MQKHETLQKIVSQARSKTSSKTGLAIELHNYVRDNVLFGFTPYFDVAKPEQTLRLGIGHCNPQAALMVALFREGDIDARFRPSLINNDVLAGVAQTPPLLSHIFTEVRLKDEWVRIDSYIVDPVLRGVATEKLKHAGRELGYGVHVAATGDWDGFESAYSQVATPKMILELYDPVEDINEFYRSTAYKHRVGKISFSVLMSPARSIPKLFSSAMNHRITRLRKESKLVAAV